MRCLINKKNYPGYAAIGQNELFKIRNYTCIRVKDGCYENPNYSDKV